jgi:hypothetical protein
MASTQAEGRLRTRILSDAHEQFLRQGEIHLTRPRVIEIAAEEGVDEADAEHVLGLLIEEGFIEAQTWHHFTAGAETALFYETEIDRPAFWRANELRRRLILAGAGAYRADEEPMLKREERGSFSDVEGASCGQRSRCSSRSVFRVRSPPP